MRYGPDLQLRRLSDGKEYRVVKVMYEPDELELLLAQEGWAAHLAAIPWFVFGSAQVESAVAPDCGTTMQPRPLRTLDISASVDAFRVAIGLHDRRSAAIHRTPEPGARERR